KARAVALTEQGIATCERLLSIDNLYDPQHITVLHHIQQGLRAHALFKRDVDYVVKDGQVIIVDEFTGRIMLARRWSDSLDPAVDDQTERPEFNAAVEDSMDRNTRGQPARVGTVSIEKSQQLAKLLKKRGGRDEVLNAKYHQREAEIVAQAGREGAVTIATNMAGRGTDILLGGNPDFLSKEMLRKKGLDPATAATAERAGALAEARRVTEPEHARVVAL